MWDPEQYRRFGDERSRPFFELMHRVRAEHPGRVADLGCGSGELTATLAERWPDAEITGIDSSAEMIRAARAVKIAPSGSGRLSFAQADVRDWRPGRPVDVIVSNAVLQWVPEHMQLLARWPTALAPGGWLAIQVPANFDQPTHLILRELADSASWRKLLPGLQINRQSPGAAEYYRLLTDAGCAVDAWETTYLHVLHGDNPVLDWVKGTALRPVLAALAADARAEFLAEYGARLRAAYPANPAGTVFGFRRAFAVARVPGSART